MFLQMDYFIKPISFISKTPPPSSTPSPPPPFITPTRSPPHHSSKPHHRHPQTHLWHPPLRAHTTNPPVSPNTGHEEEEEEEDNNHLLSLLRKRKTEEAWAVYAQSPTLPNSVCLSRLVAQLSHQNTTLSLSRARSLVRRLRDARQLHRLDANSLGLLAVSSSKSGATPYAASIVKSMLRSGYLPHVKAWSAVVSRLAASSDDGPAEAIRLFDSVLHRIRSVPDPALAVDTRPDTAAFNAVLNACANIGDTERFVKLFDEMPGFNAEPDVLTYNVMIKLCARANRKDLLVFVLERIIAEGIPPCTTTLNSLVAAYVGFGDLETAEKMVQAMREGRLDLCRVLRESSNPPEDSDSDPDSKKVEDGVFEKLLPKSAISSLTVTDPPRPPPLLPRAYYPDSRMYTTLMKGYMNQGRVTDVVRMLEAMRQQQDSSSQPDHVTYTTVISALVKSGSMDRARQMLAEMARVGVPANRITYNVLLKGYCQQIQINKARDLLHDMAADAGIEPDVVSYNILMDGCILVDDSAGALAYFNEMRARGIGPTKVSYTTLMKAFVMAGQPKLAQKVFDEMMKDPRVKADLAAWNMLVEGYCSVGLVEEAKKIVERMREKGLHPDIATYGSLANGIAQARRPGEALLLWNEIKERLEGKKKGPKIKPDEGLLDALADVCVRAAFFKKALEIVACMEEHGISPNKTKFNRIYVEMHSKMFTSKHASRARQERRSERKRAAEAFKFWLGLPNAYYGSEWRLEPLADGEY